MIITTTNTLDGYTIKDYKGVITGEAILGANIFKDIFASITNIIGGRSGAYEKSLQEARNIAMKELADQAISLGANAIIGVDVDYESIGTDGSNMLMVSVSGTAVVI
jgi:uncharacterized protein YbjQ (UPF0145 family)